MKKLPAVTAYTPEGKILVTILRGLFSVLHLFVGKKWAVPPSFFQENPLHYTVRDLIFFAYKYYFKSPEKSDYTEGSPFFISDNPLIINEGISGENESVLRKITLTAAGDLMPYEWIQPQFCAQLWDDIGDDFFSSDLTFANLETPIDVSKPPSLVPEVMLSDMLFNGNAAMFSIFNADNFTTKTGKRAGFDILSTANNHALDMGESGVYATIDFLKEKNIRHVGTSKSRENRAKTCIIEQNGIRLAFISYTFSMNTQQNPKDKSWLVNHLEVNTADVDLSVLTADVARAKQDNADIVILSLHYGNAYQAYPNAHIVDNTKRIFDECGADIILGGHPHNVQPMAVFPFICPHSGVEKRGFVLFSFGDFVAYDIFNWCHLPVYLKLEISQLQAASCKLQATSNEPSAISNELLASKKGISRFSGCQKVSYTEGSSLRTILTKVEAVPVYVCGNYRSRKDRELRFLDARKALDLVENGQIPAFMTDWNVRELRGLMQFYESFFLQKR
jgi:hypothetical protein